MPILLFILVIAILLFSYYHFNNKNKNVRPKQLADDRLISIKTIDDEPIVLAALLSLASLSYNQNDNDMVNMIESDILATLTNISNARSSLMVAEEIYLKLNDRLFVIDETANLLINKISTKDRYHLFILIKKVHEKVEHEDGISFYIKRLEKKLQLNTAN